VAPAAVTESPHRSFFTIHVRSGILYYRDESLQLDFSLAASPGDIRRYGQRGLASSDARSERPPVVLPPGGQRRLDDMLRRGSPAAAAGGASAARRQNPEHDEDEEVSPARAHPLAARPRPALQRRARKPGPSVAVADSNRPSKPARPQPPHAAEAAPAGSAADGGRVLQELPLPPRNDRESGSSCAPERQHGSAAQPTAKRAAKQAERGEAAMPAATAPAADVAGGDAAAEAGAGFGDLSHMREYALEASKALDGLKRQRRTPGKGSQLPAAVFTGGAAAAAAFTPSKSSTPARAAQQAKATAAARATIERFKQQLPRPPGRTPSKAAYGGDCEPKAAQPSAADPAELSAVPAASTPAPRRRSDTGGASADLFGELSSPQMLPDRRAAGASFGPDSLVPESPAFSLSAGLRHDGWEPQSPAAEPRWRLPGISPCRSARSDPSPVGRRLPLDGDTASPWRRRRRLSLGAVSDDWLSDPSDDELDLLASDDMAEPQRLPPGGGGGGSPPGAARRHRSSIGGVGGMACLEGIDGSNPVEAFTPSPASAMRPPLGGRRHLSAPLQSPMGVEDPLFLPRGGDGGGGGNAAATPSRAVCSPWASTTREWSDAGDSGGGGVCSRKRRASDLLSFQDDDGSEGGNSAADLLGLEADECNGDQRGAAVLLGLRDHHPGRRRRGGRQHPAAELLGLDEEEEGLQQGPQEADTGGFSPQRRRSGLLDVGDSDAAGEFDAAVAASQRAARLSSSSGDADLLQMHSQPTAVLGSQRVIPESPTDSCGISGLGGGDVRYQESSPPRMGRSSSGPLGLPEVDERAELNAVLASATSERPSSSFAMHMDLDGADGEEPVADGGAPWQTELQRQPRVQPAKSHPASNCFGQFMFKRAELCFLSR